MKGKKLTIKIIIMLLVLFAICLASDNVKAFTLTLTPRPERNAIQLDWDSPEGNLYKVWQLKPGDIEYQTISAIDVYNYSEKVQVLNIHPNAGEQVSFTTYDGEKINIAKSRKFKKMDGRTKFRRY